MIKKSVTSYFSQKTCFSTKMSFKASVKKDFLIMNMTKQKDCLLQVLFCGLYRDFVSYLQMLPTTFPKHNFEKLKF